MPLDILNEINKVKEYYNSDPRQQRYSALITAESGAGKTYLAHTCRMPVHIDSFDPGGTKCLRPWIEEGKIIADTRWEAEDPAAPKAFNNWKRETDFRMREGYFDHFGTYILDSATTWADAAMNAQLASENRAGEAPKFTKDYTPQKIAMINYIKKLMNLPCDFILTGHLKTIEDVVGTDREGNPLKKVRYRFLTTGQASVTIPLQFDELYVLLTKPSPRGLERYLLTEAQGEYLARSRLKANQKLESQEPADIKKLLKKIGLAWEDKPLFN